jgi:hypothetical protein
MEDQQSLEQQAINVDEPLSHEQQTVDLVEPQPEVSSPCV